MKRDGNENRMFRWIFGIIAVFLLAGGVQDYRTRRRKNALQKRLEVSGGDGRVFLSADGNCAVMAGGDGTVRIAEADGQEVWTFASAELLEVQVVEDGIPILSSQDRGRGVRRPEGEKARRRVRELCVLIRTGGGQEHEFYLSFLNTPSESRRSAFYRARFRDTEELFDALCEVMDRAAEPEYCGSSAGCV